jgi:hypothetical protein
VGSDLILFKSLSKNTFYANISISGIGYWQQTTSYPVPFGGGSCTTTNGYIYCIGTNNLTSSSDVYYAKLSPNGIGQWQKTTSYPTRFSGGQCNIYNAYMNFTKPNNSLIGSSSAAESYINSFYSQHFGSYNYYAPVSNSGIGTWKQITIPKQPINGDSCVISDEVVFCIGGTNAYESIQNVSIFNITGHFNSTINYTQLENITNSSEFNLSSLFPTTNPFQQLNLFNSTSQVSYAYINPNGTGIPPTPILPSCKFQDASQPTVMYIA